MTEPGRVSVIIPACNEKFLQATIDSLLGQAAGDVEIWAVLDGGPWPNPPLTDDPRVHTIRHNESKGMRPSINEAADLAHGQYLLKCDAHCIFAPGWDEALKADCEEETLVVPTRHSVNGATWTMKPRNWNYHILTFPFLPSMYGMGLHAVTFAWDENKRLNAECADREIDDLLAAQGSCWFQHRSTFLRDGPLDHDHFYFYQESQETMLRRWLKGGRCVINKRTWYAHYHKGNNNQHTTDGRIGRGFFLNLKRKRESEAYSIDYFLKDRCVGATRTFVSLIEQFWPLISRMTDPRYAWPEDWRDWDKHRAAFENRPPEAIPEHL